jgi:hypothetical protein
MQEGRAGDVLEMDFKEISCEVVEWIHLAQDRVQRRVNIGFNRRREIPGYLGYC